MTDYIAKDYGTIRPLDEKSLIELFQSFFEADKREDIELLEPGCGPGRLLKVLANVSNINLTGIDIREDIFNIAKTSFNGTYNVKILHGNFLDHDFHDKKYDYVLFSHYLHLQSNADEHINKAKRLLKKGGRLLVLYEDCSYYALLLGYPPALAEHHSFLKLFKSIQADTSLKEKFKPSGPYLPHEIADKCSPSEFNLFPITTSYTCKKEVKWSEECINKNASVFHFLSEAELAKCMDIGNSLEDAFQIQPYLFYTENKLSCRHQDTTKKVSVGNGGQLNVNQFFDYLQGSFSDLFTEIPSVFLSTWAIHKNADSDDRDVLFAGLIPKSELSNWYYSYKKSLEGFSPDYSPSYVVGTKNDSLNPVHPKISFKKLQKDLTNLYKSFNISHSTEDIQKYIADSLKPTLDRLFSLHKYVNNDLKKLFFYYLNFQPQKEDRIVMPIVILSTSELSYEKRNLVLNVFKQCPPVDESVAQIFSPVVRDRIRWIDIDRKDLSSGLTEIKNNATQMIEKINELMIGNCHTLQRIVANQGNCEALRNKYCELRNFFLDLDILRHDNNDVDSKVKLVCLFYRLKRSRLCLWDWLEYIKYTLGHTTPIIAEGLDIRHSEYYFELSLLDINKIFKILGEELHDMTWEHNVLVSDTEKSEGKLVEYRLKITSKAENRATFTLYYEIDNHQNTKIWHVLQKLFGGPLFQFNVSDTWASSKLFSKGKTSGDYLLITVDRQNKQIIVEGCKKWELSS